MDCAEIASVQVKRTNHDPRCLAHGIDDRARIQLALTGSSRHVTSQATHGSS
jgi:hypothetical protein